ncbi:MULTISPECIES: hypothetical protein [Myroides]|uniref:hypothetical protein n=1 Tax=Myroides TaxID=76831 RepID=UPI0015FB7A50|nr:MULTISPECIES: hypothetical protein [Myroides]MBB1139294.1 hypothetical protein [Myroides sp. WP-1]MDM1499639.1 hypothetical protein [Myroides odoratimimus]
MLQAIKNKKAGRNFKGTEIQWSSLFEGSEDSLTSSVVGTLLYLPDTIIWTILNQAVGYNLISIDEPIEDFIFWPSWNSKYTANRNFVEPDVFIETPHYNIIIEAKKADGKGQDINQWKRELIAHQNEYCNVGNKKDVIFIALGGVSEDKKVPIEISSFTEDLLPEGYDRKFTITQLQWKTLLKTCLDQKYTLEYITDEYNQATLRILNDIIEYFEIHKVYRLKYFSDINYPNYKVKDYPLSSFTLI